MLVESGDGFEFLAGEGKLEKFKIFAEVVERLGLWNGEGAALHGPAEGDLGG